MQPCKQIRKNLKNRLPILPPFFSENQKHSWQHFKELHLPHNRPTGKTSFPNANIQKTFQTSKKSHTFFSKKHPLLPKTFHTFAFGQWRYRPHTYWILKKRYAHLVIGNLRNFRINARCWRSGFHAIAWKCYITSSFMGFLRVFC